MPTRSAPPSGPIPRSADLLHALLGSVVVLMLVAAVAVIGLSGRGEPGRAPRGDGLVAADVGRGTALVAPPAIARNADLEVWAAGMAERSSVPARALQAYGGAELAQRSRTSGCGLSWATLAGIARVESDHGRLGPADLDADGVARPLIIGIPLDGSNGTREIADTDGGRLDGDTVYDRAVGPMQFLPTTWKLFGADGNGDGVRDPHQLDDAARAAAAYLCEGGRDMADGDGWWDGVLAYNRSLSYAQLVWAAADRYATAARA